MFCCCCFVFSFFYFLPVGKKMSDKQARVAEWLLIANRLLVIRSDSSQAAAARNSSFYIFPHWFFFFFSKGTNKTKTKKNWKIMSKRKSILSDFCSVAKAQLGHAFKRRDLFHHMSPVFRSSRNKLLLMDAVAENLVIAQRSCIHSSTANT